MHLNAIGNRNVSYNQESFVTAYYDVLIHGLTITKAGFISIEIILFPFSFQFLNSSLYFCWKPSHRLLWSIRFLERLWNITWKERQLMILIKKWDFRFQPSLHNTPKKKKIWLKQYRGGLCMFVYFRFKI